MAWGKLDDGFYDNPKIVRIARQSHGAVGIHARAISYCAKHLTDGHIPAEVVQGFAPLQRDREQMVEVLIAERAWYKSEDGYILHDYLDQNPSKEEVEAKRAEDRERKRKERARRNG